MPLSLDKGGMGNDAPAWSSGDSGKAIQVELTAKGFKFGLIKVIGEDLCDKLFGFVNFETVPRNPADNVSKSLAVGVLEHQVEFPRKGRLLKLFLVIAHIKGLFRNNWLVFASLAAQEFKGLFNGCVAFEFGLKRVEFVFNRIVFHWMKEIEEKVFIHIAGAGKDGIQANGKA